MKRASRVYRIAWVVSLVLLTATLQIAQAQTATCPTPAPTTPSPSQTVDLKLLVVNYPAANYAAFPAIVQALNYLGVPYDVVDVLHGSLPNGAPPTLSDGACHGFYQGIIYAFGDDIYTNGVLHANLTAYERTFGVRRLNWYLNPVPDFGLNATSTYLTDTQTDAGTFTAAAGPIFFYANTKTPVSIANAFIYLTTPVAPNTVSSNGTITSVAPLLTDSQGHALSAITQFSDGRQYLNQMFDSNPYLMHNLILAYGLINWVSKGMFLGDYHVYASPQIDDFFIADSEWVPRTACGTAPDAASLPLFRVTYTDMSRLVTWQNTKQTDPLLSNFKLTLAFNGVGTAGNSDWTGLRVGATDTLVSNLSRYEQYFHWIGHTFNHPNTLNGLHKSDPGGDLYNNPQTDSIDMELLTNLYVAGNANGQNLDTDPSDADLKPLVFTDFNPMNMVTPGVTGLNDPNTPQYLYQDGIRYVVTDTSVVGQPNNGPNPSPNVGIMNSFQPGLYEVPRRPNNIFYNAANWADDRAEFNCLYPNAPFAGWNAAQILDFVSSSFVTNMLMGDMDPEMFHQPNLHFSNNASALGLSGTYTSSPLSDVYDQTFSKYEAVYALPVLSPTLDQLGQLMQNRDSFNKSGVTASVMGLGGASPTVTISMPSTASVPSAVIPITGAKSTGSEIYGGQNISHIKINAGQTITLGGQSQSGPALINATPIAAVCQSSSVRTTIPATTTGSLLIAVFQSDVRNASSVTATGATFAAKLQGHYRGYDQAYSARNVAGGISSVNVNYSGFQCLNGGWIFEITGAATASDPWGTAAGYGNSFGASSLRTGTITAGGSGLTIAAFMDYYNQATGYSSGSGWTPGVTGANHDYYEFRASTNGSSYGGTGQATVTGGADGARVDSLIFNIKGQ